MRTWNEKRVIGRREVVDFPELQLFGIDAKVDTGAFTSSIHCSDIEVVTKEGLRMVRFRLLDEAHPAYDHKQFTLPIFEHKRIKSSSGHSRKRYIIQTKIRMFMEEHNIELSLADRSKMEFPVLLGRKLLKNNFIVDVNLYNLSKRYSRIKKKTNS